MLKLGEEYGFKTKNYENYVGALWLEDGPMENTIGMWNHLDVVPVGDNWEYPPFEGVIKHGYIIGRGAQDNKGPAVGMLYLMRCLKELNIPMKHRLCLFVGCDEERGMSDLEYYCAHYDTPRDHIQVAPYFYVRLSFCVFAVADLYAAAAAVLCLKPIGFCNFNHAVRRILTALSVYKGLISRHGHAGNPYQAAHVLHKFLFTVRNPPVNFI